MLVSVPVVVVVVSVVNTVEVAVAVLVIVGIDKYEEQNGVADEYVARAFTTALTTRHSTCEMMLTGVALTATPAAARNAVAVRKCILREETGFN